MSVESQPHPNEPAHTPVITEDRDARRDIPETVLADAEHGRVVNAEVVARISELLGVPVPPMFETAGGAQLCWTIRMETYRLSLTAYADAWPATVTGDSAVQYMALPWQGGAKHITSHNLRGISRITFDPAEPDYVRFIQEDERHYAQLLVVRDGSTAMSSEMTLFKRHP